MSSSTRDVAAIGSSRAWRRHRARPNGCRRSIAPGACPAPSPNRRTLWIVATLVALAVVLAGVAVTLTRNSGGGPTAETTTNADIGTFLDRIENVLEQSAAGRREIRRSAERRVQLLDLARRSRTTNLQRRRQPPEHPRATRQPAGTDAGDGRHRDVATACAPAVDRSRPSLPRWIPGDPGGHPLSLAVQSELRSRREFGQARHRRKETVRRSFRPACPRTAAARRGRRAVSERDPDRSRRGREEREGKRRAPRAGLFMGFGRVELRLSRAAAPADFPRLPSTFLRLAEPCGRRLDSQRRGTRRGE